MALYALFYWIIVFLVFVAYLYMKFLRSYEMPTRRFK